MEASSNSKDIADDNNLILSELMISYWAAFMAVLGSTWST